MDFVVVGSSVGDSVVGFNVGLSTVFPIGFAVVGFFAGEFFVNSGPLIFSRSCEADIDGDEDTAEQERQRSRRDREEAQAKQRKGRSAEETTQQGFEQAESGELAAQAAQ